MGFALAPKDERIRLPAVSLGHRPPVARRKSGPRNTAIKLATPDYPKNEWVKTVCKVGGGKDCCRYLIMACTGWSCEKKSPLAHVIDWRVTKGTWKATGSDCPGKDARRGCA